MFLESIGWDVISDGGSRGRGARVRTTTLRQNDGTTHEQEFIFTYKETKPCVAAGDYWDIHSDKLSVQG